LCPNLRAWLQRVRPFSCDTQFSNIGSVVGTSARPSPTSNASGRARILRKPFAVKIARRRPSGARACGVMMVAMSSWNTIFRPNSSSSNTDRQDRSELNTIVFGIERRTCLQTPDSADIERASSQAQCRRIEQALDRQNEVSHRRYGTVCRQRERAPCLWVREESLALAATS